MADLSGAYLRANWAYERLKTLSETVQAFVDVEADAIGFQGSVDAEGMSVEVSGHRPIPPEIPMLLSEVVFHLRAALDYLAYELSALGEGGDDPKGTQFPIESTAQGFAGRTRTYLNGVSDSNKALIERLQPYNGGDWLVLLRDLSNRDKHRTITLTTHRFRMAVRPVGPPEKTPAGRVRVKMNFEGVLSIAFENGTPVVKTLDLLHTQVAQTVDLFRSQFE